MKNNIQNGNIITSIKFFSFQLAQSARRRCFALIAFVFIIVANLNAQIVVDYSTLLNGEAGALNPVEVIAQNGIAYHAGYTNGGPSTTDGTSHSGPATGSSGRDVYFAAHDADGTILYSSIFGGTAIEHVYDFFLDGTHGYIVGYTQSLDFTGTDGHTNTVDFNTYITKFELATGNVVYTKIPDVSDRTVYRFGEVINGVPTVFGYTLASDFPFTDGSSFASPDQYDLFSATLDASGNITTANRVLDGNGNDFIDGGSYVNGKWELYGETFSTDIVSSNGTSHMGDRDVYYAQYDPVANTVNKFTYIGSTERDDVDDFVFKDGKVYFLLKPRGAGLPVTDGSSFGSAIGQRGIYLAAMDENLDLTFGLYYPSDKNNFGTNQLEVDDNGFPIVAINTASELPITDGQSNVNDNSIDLYIIKHTPTGEIVYSNRSVSQSSMFAADLVVLDDRIVYSGGYFTSGGGTQTTHPNYPLTDGSNYGTQEGQNMFLTVLKNDGTTMYSATVSGTSGDRVNDIFVSNDGKVYVLGESYSPDQPVTDNTVAVGSTLQVSGMLIVFDMCPSDFDGPTELTGGTAIACQNGLLDEIKAGKVIYEGSLNPLVGGGVVYNQPDVESLYQWQSATTATGPWVDIPGAVLQNFTPQPVVTDRYYRREARLSNYCNNELVHTTDVFHVEINNLTAPDVYAGGVFTTCPSVPVTLGGTPTASNGVAPYTYVWEAGTTVISTDANPTVAPTETTIYTVTVTDANGCKQLDQAQVNVYAADAFVGAQASVCAGEGVRLGAPAIPGLGGVIYAWTPNDGTLSCIDCAQPIATPTNTTTYTLTQTVPVTGGGFCTTSDMASVTIENAPTTNGGEFAGIDKVICRGETTMLGETPEAGFSYTWAPGQYLTDNANSETTFQPGSLTLPNKEATVPNPITYYITAETGGCTFTDDVKAYVTEADAGLDGCGPRVVGVGDKTPHFEETYLWEVISGDGFITGATNTATTTVSSSPTTTTIYRLTTTFLGYSCTDEVEVPVCGCVVGIDTDGEFECPDFDFHNGTVCLIATAATVEESDADLFTYSWSPQEGLSTYTGREVCLIDNVNRTYTVTMTDPSNPAHSCTETIEVNGPAWALPVFDAQAVIACPGDDVSIGQPTVSGYSYSWRNVVAPDNVISNPTINAVENEVFYVTVTDDGTGCAVVDTASITLLDAPTAGKDLLICDNSTFTLGTSSGNPTFYNYSWEPSSANWQNGTDENSPNPQVLVAINTTFTMTATDPVSGCNVVETVEVTVGNPITPFTLADVEHCPSDGPAQLGNGVPAGLSSYLWAPAALLVDPSIAEPLTIDPSPSGVTEFTLIATNADGCEIQVPQNLNSPFDAPMTSGNKFICVDESVNIGSDNNPTAATITYAWSPTTDLDDSTSPNPLFTATSVGTFTYTVTKIQNGCSITSLVEVTVNEFNLPAIPSELVCQGTCVQIGTTPETGVTYEWTPATGLSNAFIANPTACVDASTTYTLVARSPNGCVDVAEVSVNVQPTQAPIITLANETGCTADGAIMLNPIVTPTDNYTYVWTPNDGSLSDVNIANPTADILLVGTQTFDLTVTNIATGCASTASINVTYESCPATCTETIAIGTTSDPTTCNGSEGTIEITGLTPNTTYTLSYDKDGNAQGPLSISTNASGSYVIPDLTIGAYTNINTSLAGCIPNNSVSATLNAPPLPTITAMSVDPTSCGATDGSITFTFTNVSDGLYMINYTDVTSTNQTFDNVTVNSSTATITGLGAGTYNDLSITTNNCTSTENVDIVLMDNCGFDYGDLPDSSAGTASLDYQTTLANNGPSHVVTPNLYFGATVDLELDGQSSPDAEGDGADEDGYTALHSVNANFVGGGTINFPYNVTNNTGVIAHLEAWIDWNGDGDFDDLNEQVLDVSDDGNGDFGSSDFSINIPNTGIVFNQNIGTRFRLSHTDNMTPLGPASAGEVEDYLIQVACPPASCLPVTITY